MAWWNRRKPEVGDDLTSVVEPAVPPHNLVTTGLRGAAFLVNTEAVKQSRTKIIPEYESWQKELWDAYDSIGEFALVVDWRSSMISRIRLRAAEIKPDSDEPMIVDSGPAADLVDELFGGVGQRAEMLGTISTFLDVPGEGWLLGETKDKVNTWSIRSSDEIRLQSGKYEVLSELSTPKKQVWRPIEEEYFLTRIWRPHKRLHYMAHSPARVARTAMQELDYVNQFITTQFVSRLASAGIVVFPDEVSFPVREEFQDAPDPFAKEWITTAAESIKNFGAAARHIPIPMRMPGEWIDKIKYIDFTVHIDDRIIEKRDSARRRLCNILNVPADLLFDAGDMNHWGLWQLEEGALKVYITPDAELIATALTVGYLHPRLKASGMSPEEIARWCIWYDASELIARPDKSNNATAAYDRFELSGKALRREAGFDEDDAPTQTELSELVLKKLAANPQVGLQALQELTGTVVDQPTPPESEAPTEDVVEPEEDERSTPHTEDMMPEEGAARVAGGLRYDATTILQAKSQHVIEFNVSGWKLKHPKLCEPRLFSCPFTHATFGGVSIHPGTSGDYECMMSSTGEFVIGQRIFPALDSLIPTRPGSLNGHDHQPRS